MTEKLRDTPKQENDIITSEGTKTCYIARMSDWKAAEPDHVQGFWFKKATSLHTKLKQHLQECVNAGVVPTWMTEGRTVLIMKDNSKGTVVGNYISNCLPSTDVETVDKYVLRSNVWTFELPATIAKRT